MKAIFGGKLKMLPNKMRISERALKALMRLQGNTGLTPNIGARIAFFKSIEGSFRFRPGQDIIDTKGRELDKHSWLGDHPEIVEMLLKQMYPSVSNKELYNAWNKHVDDGATMIENVRDIVALTMIR